ncbi:MAG: glycosyltransferase family 39 protein [Bryobacteraceae bacterium]
MRNIWLELALVCVSLTAIGGLATVYVNHSGWTLYYGDAEAHLDIARRVMDSRRPGYEQLGTVWLPLPHLLMLPLVRNDALWRTGLAGAIPSSACFVCAGVFLYAALRRAARSSAVALASLGLLALNPNLLYLQATPMTETVALAALMALLYFTVLFHQTQSLAAVMGAGIASIAASLARYEGWFVIPFVALYFLIVGRGWKRFGAAALFCAIAVLGPLYWLAHNWWLYSNPLEFYNGPYSAVAIYRRALAQNMAPYRGDHDWQMAALYYLTALRLCAGLTVVVIAIAGLAGVLLKRVFWPILFAAIPPLFYVWSMHSGGTPIFVPSLWPFSYYNTRYALAALPLLAIAGGCLVLLGPRRFRPWIAVAIMIAAAVPWMIRPQPSDWVTWKESQINSLTRRAWTKAAASSLAGDYHSGGGIVTSFSELTGILRQAGIPLREALYNGDEPDWPAATARPDLFLHEEWALAISGDAVATAIQRSSLKSGPRYHLVQTVKVKGAPVIEIYKRD